MAALLLPAFCWTSVCAGARWSAQTWDKLVIIPGEPQWWWWGGPSFDNIYLLFISCCSLDGDDVPQVCDLLAEYLAFWGLKFQSGPFKFLKHSLQPHEMDGWVFQKDDFIIQVDYTPILVEVPEAGFHQLLKGGGGIGQSKRHSVTLIESQWPYCECSQWFSLLIHLDLPVLRLQVKHGEPLGSLQNVEGLIDVGQWEVSLTVWLFNFLRSMQNFRLPALFLD